MQIEMMRCFLALAYYHNFSIAAESLYISQSTLSKRIMAMEKELNVALFERKVRSVNLTAAGQRIYSRIERIINEYDEILSSIRDIDSKQQRILTISSMCDMGQYGITEMIIGFERKNAGVIAETQEKSHSVMKEELEHNRINCAIGYRELLGGMKGYKEQVLMQDRLVLVYSREHSLSKRTTVNLGDAKYYRFCFPKEDRLFFEYILRLCARVGFTPELTKSDVRISTIREYILRGMRITITTQSRADRIFFDPEFIVMPLPKEDTLHLVLLTKNGLSDHMYEEFGTYAMGYY